MKLRITQLLVICTLFAFPYRSAAQSFELGALAGGSYYYGDIVNYSFQSESIKPSFGVYGRYNITPSFSVRANLMYCRIFAADSNLDETNDTRWQKSRNLAFYSDIFEASGVMEYNFIEDNTNGGYVRNRFIPYVFGGVGVFYFNPKAIHPITGDPIALSPLKLNGSSYSPIAFAVPFGFGVRCYINGSWQVGLEMGIRYTSTTYLDDISGESTYPDAELLPSDDARIMASRNKNSINSNTQMVSNYEGKPRGKIDYINDLYYIYGVTVSYKLSNGFGKF
ncbi:MAG: DUF6089 family protein [Bacteroidota bacterium]